jgi:hypothetical protein
MPQILLQCRFVSHHHHHHYPLAIKIICFHIMITVLMQTMTGVCAIYIYMQESTLHGA